MKPARLSYEESFRHLQKVGCLAEGPVFPLPDHRPQFDDESPRVSFFRTWLGSGTPFGLQASSPEDEGGGLDEHALENLNLPRTFFGRSEISYISFKNTDLSESTLCWNDFIEVNFTDADLSECDLRASIFKHTPLCAQPSEMPTFACPHSRNATLRAPTCEGQS